MIHCIAYGILTKKKEGREKKKHIKSKERLWMDAYDTRKYFINIQGREREKKNESKYKNIDINIVLLLIVSP